MHDAPPVALEDLSPAERREREAQNAAPSARLARRCDEETERRLAAVDLPAHIDRDALTKSQRRRIAIFAPPSDAPSSALAPPPSSPSAPTSADALPLVLTVEEVAALLRVERRHIYGLVARKTLPGAFYLGRALRFNRDTVLGWLARDGQGRVRRKA